MMVDLDAIVDIDPKEVGVTELVYYPVLAGLLEETAGDIDELKDAIKRDIHDLIPKHITKEDILASINYNMHLEYGIGTDDDIDHLGNRRIRAVGELCACLCNYFSGNRTCNILSKNLSCNTVFQIRACSA